MILFRLGAATGSATPDRAGHAASVERQRRQRRRRRGRRHRGGRRHRQPERPLRQRERRPGRLREPRTRPPLPTRPRARQAATMDRAGAAAAACPSEQRACGARDHERRWRRERPHEHLPGRQHHPGLRSHRRGQRGPGHELDPRQPRRGAAVHRGHPRQPPRPLVGCFGTRRVRHRLAAPHPRLQRLRQRLTRRAGGGAAQRRAGCAPSDPTRASPRSIAPTWARPPRYLWIEEVETTGGSRFLGPYDREDDALPRAFEDVRRRVLAASDRRDETRRERAVAARAGVLGPGAARSSARGAASPGLRREAPAAVARALRIEVASAGVVRLPLADLQAQGLPPGALAWRGARLSLLGRSVPYRLESGDLVFQAEAFSTDYTDHASYVLSWGLLAPPPRVPLTRSELPRRSGLRPRRGEPVLRALSAP